MGSFYSTCSVTGMTLSHQKVARLLLVPASLCFKEWRDENSPISYDSRNRFKESGLIVSNEGAQAVFSPFGFPIRGKYYDYGQLDEIERDKNVEMLEEYFGLTIEKILDAASDKRWYEYGIERPAECLKEIAAAEKDLLDYLLEPEQDSEVVAEKKKNVEDLKTKHAYDIYESPKHWKIIENEPKHLNLLLRLTYTDIREEIYDFLADEQAKSKEYWYREIGDNISTYLKEVDKDKEIIEGDDEILKIISRFKSRERGLIPSLCKDNFLEIFKIGSEFEKEYRKLYYFIIALGRVDKILLPSNYGGQETNFKQLAALNRKANALMREDMKY